MEPLGTLHNLVEIEIRWVSLSNCAVCTVVDYLGWSHRSTSLGIVETYAVATTSDELCVNAVTTETVDSNLTDLVLCLRTIQKIVVYLRQNSHLWSHTTELLNTNCGLCTARKYLRRFIYRSPQERLLI